MYVDIVFPKNNEEGFISVAEKLGYSGICFVYDYSGDARKIQQKIDELNKKSRIGIYLGFVAKPKDCARAGNHAELVLVKSSDKDQDALEKINFDILFNSELNPRKDAMHFRSSGLNQVLCRIAAKKKKIIGINFRNILDSDNKPKIIGRIIQNTTLCRKFKTKITLFSGAGKPLQMKGHSDLISMMVMFGLKPDEAKQVLRNTEERIKKNIKKKSPEYIKEGVEIIKG